MTPISDRKDNMIPTPNLWTSPPEKPVLKEKQVHLWRFRLDLSPTETVKLKHLLSDDERGRADKLINPLKSNYFMVARGRIRQILAIYLDLLPHHIRFAYGEHGKPELKKHIEYTLTFNLSHTGPWGLLAVTQGTAIGVDIETIDPKSDYDKMAVGFFSTPELETLEQCSTNRRRRLFYRIWTRKEAELKRVGTGFTNPQAGQHFNMGTIRSFVVDRNTLGAVTTTNDVTEVLRWDLT
jgi:4'-phosphopantetheinyl transferase